MKPLSSFEATPGHARLEALLGRCLRAVLECTEAGSAMVTQRPKIVQWAADQRTHESPEWPQQWVCSKPTGVTGSPDLVWLIWRAVPQRSPAQAGRLSPCLPRQVPRHQRFLSTCYQRFLVPQPSAGSSATWNGASGALGPQHGPAFRCLAAPSSLNGAHSSGLGYTCFLVRMRTGPVTM
jgi:hypothetical protein